MFWGSAEANLLGGGVRQWKYATGVSRPAVLTTKAFLPHQRVTTEGKAMAIDATLKLNN
jgi:hypothetical protein